MSLISQLDPQVIAAIIGLIGILIGYALGWMRQNRELRAENERLKIEKARVSNENEQLRTQQKHDSRQAQVWQSEIEKNKAEVARLQFLMDEIRNKPFEVERSEIHSLINLLEQSSIDILDEGKDPIEIFRAMRKIHASLQKRGAFIIHDNETTKNLVKLKVILQQTQTRVRKRCPLLIKFVDELEQASSGSSQERLKWLSELGREINCTEVMKLIFQKYGEILSIIENIRDRLQVLES
jgi:hypothetical protein